MQMHHDEAAHTEVTNCVHVLLYFFYVKREIKVESNK